MNKTDEERILAAVRDKDIVEVLSVLMCAGNVYSRRILRFFRWFCKWVPIALMLFHIYGIYDFSRSPREMFSVHRENWACYAFIYFMVYLLPMVMILASRFFFLCWKFRIPFFYFFGVNAIHIAYWSWYTTNEMVMPHFCLMVMVASFYLYGCLDVFFTKHKDACGRGKIF